MAVRNAGFDRGWKQIHHAAVPVVSVGNLTLGGTGKTPMVEWLARWYRRRGVRVAILSRGYGQTGGLNDEGRVLEENLPDVPHLQDPDRVALAGVATRELESELIVLDDGFQHRRLARDVDLVLLDALEPFGLGHLFPRGLLREPIRSLRRARCGRLVASRSRRRRPTAWRFGAEAERQAGPLRWVEARHAPLDLIDGEGSASSARPARGPVGRGVLRDRQPGRISAHPAPVVPRAARPPRLPRSSRLLCGGCRVSGTLGRRAGGQSRLDHTEGFGQAVRRLAGACPAPSASESGSKSRRGGISWTTSWPGSFPRECGMSRIEKDFS